MKHLKAWSWYMPDTTLHPLNGDYVVDIGPMRDWLKHNPPWLSTDEADAFAESLKHAATLAREGQWSCDSDDSEETHENA